MKIMKELINELLEICRDTHPNEFFAFLTGNRGVIKEYIYIPFKQGRDFVSIDTSLLPLGMKIYGTVHSHPSHSPNPSPQDLSTFSSFGRVHIIVYYPYCRECWRAFDSSGNAISIDVV